jgi:multiple sugar transport system permease protein
MANRLVATAARWRGSKYSEWGWAYLLLLPSIVLFVLFVVYPIFSTISLSFQQWDLLTPAEFVGLQNYQELLVDDRLGTIIGNTLLFTVLAVALKVVLGLVIAFAVWSIKPKFVSAFAESAIFFPVILPMSIVALVWGILLNTNVGVVNGLLGLVGIGKVPWLTNADWALRSIVLLDVWKGLGFFVIIFMVALKNVPRDYYDAAAVDGADTWAQFRYITLPSISPTTLFLTIIAIIGSLQVFDQAYILTRGGPGDATRTFVYYLWENAFQFRNMGYAATLALLLFGFILVVTFLQFAFSKKWVVYD